MKKMRLIFVIVLLLFPFMGQAQNIRELFVAMPDSVCPLLTTVNRADFGDFLDSGMKAVVKNRFGKVSEMKEMTEDYIKLVLTSVDEWEMKLLPLTDSVSVVCVVKTYASAVHDSYLEFYDTQWNRLPTEDFVRLPADDDFFKSSLTAVQNDSLQSMRMNVGMNLMEMNLSPDADVLVLRCRLADYMSKEDKGKFPDFLDEDIVYRWIDGKFVKP